MQLGENPSHSTSGSTQTCSFLPASSGSMPSGPRCTFPNGCRGAKGCGSRETPYFCT